MENIEPGIGHNQPDELTTLTARAEALVAMANRWITEVSEIIDESTAEKCDSFIGQIGDEIKAIEINRTTEVKPHNDAVTLINDAHKKLHNSSKKTGVLDVAKKLLNDMRTKWLQIKEAERLEKVRIAEEETRQAQREAEAARIEAEAMAGDVVQNLVAADEAEAEAKDAAKAATKISNSRAQVKGAFSDRAASLRTSWEAEITDFDKALGHYRNHPKVRDLIQTLANQDARSPEKRQGSEIPGVEFKDHQTAA